MSMHRVLIRVETVSPRAVAVVIPSWRRDAGVIIPKLAMAGDVAEAVAAGDYLLGYVNIGALDANDLRFENINEIVANTPVTQP